jgi:hypothetical protein
MIQRHVIAALSGGAALALTFSNPSFSDFQKQKLEPVSDYATSETERGALGFVRKIEESIIPGWKILLDSAQASDRAELLHSLTIHTDRRSLGLFSFYSTKLKGCESDYVAAVGLFWPTFDGCGLEPTTKGGNH